MTKPIPGQTFPLTQPGHLSNTGDAIQRDMNTPVDGYGQPNIVLGSRDAFHVPSVLVTWAKPHVAGSGSSDGDRLSGHRMPGANVRFTNVQQTQVEPCEYDERQAVADPFLETIRAGVAFWVFIIPELVGGLTHNFEILPKDDPLDNIEDEFEEPEEDGCGGCWGD
jgi:hypothetical protein